jgi:general nucleoside transport system ATP-binding protein
LTTPAPALEMRAVEKSFGRTTALSGASLVVRSGSLHMLLGENGAGKTTLLRIAAGFEHADAGSVMIDGSEAHWRQPADAIAGGVTAVQQHFALVPAMTVAENIALAGSRLLASYDPGRAAADVRAIGARLGLAVDPNVVVGELGVAGQQTVEIIKALTHGPRILILDEPTAVLAPAEARALYEWLHAFVDSGNTAVVITHHVREAREHGDAITVLRHGRTVLEVPRRGESEADVVAAILGGGSDGSPSHGATQAYATEPASDEIVACATDVSVLNQAGQMRLRGASVTIRRSEVVGVAGVDGAGQRELLRVLSGRVSPVTGTITCPESIAFIPEDRLRDAIIPEFTLTENFALRGLANRSGTLTWSREAEQARRCITEFDVRGAVPQTPVGTLSGGNQQRFVLGRELSSSPDLIVAESPTRGLDIRAAASILQLLRDRAAAGAAVVMYSSDIDELLHVADRVVVCQQGRVHQVALSADSIGAAMIGVT